MARFHALLCFVFVLGLVSSAIPAPAQSPPPMAAARKLAPAKSPAAPSPASPPATSATVSSPASAPSKVATPPTSAFSPTAQTPASSPSVEGPASASPPSASSRAVPTANLEKMGIFGAALLGVAAFLL